MSEYCLYASEISAQNLPNVERFGKSDPLCEIEFQGTKGKTEVISDELNPVWKEKIQIDLQGKPLSISDSLTVKVYDHEKIGKNKLLGQATVKLKDVVKDKSHQMQVSMRLQDAQGQPSESQFSCKLHYKCPEEKPATQTDAGQSESAFEGEEEGEEGEEGEGDEGGDAGEPGAPGGARKRKRRRRKRKGHSLPNKPMDFQVRIKVVEGRQLSGANINPVVRVTVGDQVKQTRVKKSTNRPYYNQTFFYNFGNITPDELFDKIVKFEVFNSRRLRSDALVGFFKCDVGLIYEGKDHALLRKWILLTEPEVPETDVKATPDEGKAPEPTSTLGGTPAGYVKTSMVCIAPGNDPPSLDESMKDDTAEDIESNLLQPPGVQLRPAVFKLKLFHAEDLPQMDTSMGQSVKKFFGFGKDAKEMVDPYAKFTFAGKSVKTDVYTETDNPDFNSVLSVPFQFPSMCEKLKIQCYDWDRITEDDCIGTCFINMSNISGQGEEGFLPLFGPCFVNMYGSIREFSELPDEFDDLNKGIGEGVCYRGRVLVQLETELDEEVEDELAEIPQDDIVLVQPFLRRRKYKLYACFLEATMISIDDSPVEFEVSIGNYGNKLDRSVEPSCSTTPPTNPVFDGEFYYYLPWGNSKPCVNVESHWEDINFRLDPLNRLLKIVDRLERNMKNVNVSVDSKAPTAETASLLIALLDQLINDCQTPIPQFDLSKMGVTRLDMKNQEIRVDELAAIAEEATKLRESATDVQEALSEIQSYLSRLKDVAVEPQNSMPDVIVWMLSGNTRVAYHRIPAYHLLYSDDDEARGMYCRKVLDIELKYPGKKGRNTKDHPEVPALIRCMLWLGLENQAKDWTAQQSEASFTVYAETYENQQNVLGNWTSKAMLRPKFSDSKGDFKLPKDKFIPPDGWAFEGDWFLNPELSINYSKDSGRKLFLEDTFECETRTIPGGAWAPAAVPWQEVHGDACVDLQDQPIKSRDQLVCPKGWEWTEDWVVDMNRAVDENGWEYTIEQSWVGFGPVEKTYHLCRRRRWVRERKLVVDVQKAEADKARKQQLAAEGWEYAKVFTTKFHVKKRSMDLVRRRRWHRKLVQKSADAAAPVFRMDVGDKDEAEHTMNSPRMFLTFAKPHSYQLRAYIYQARDLIPSDQGGYSDPYVRVAFGSVSQTTQPLEKTLCPTWDQTLIFEKLVIHGAVEKVVENPPNIIMEIYDKDQVGKDEFLGRARAEPVVRVNGSEGTHARLAWYTIEKGDCCGGDILAAFELFLDEGAELPFAPPMRNDLYLVPNGVRPVLQRTGVEVMCWGLRNMKKYQLTSVTSPSIDFEIGDQKITSTVIKNLKRNPNFDQPLFFFDVYLPKEEIYSPPLRIKVRDHRTFGRAPVVGTHLIRSLAPFRREVPQEDTQSITQDLMDEQDAPPATAVVEVKEEAKDPKEDEQIDWWSKFYASIGDDAKAGDYLGKGYDKMTIYPHALEKVEDFGGLSDFVDTFLLYRGKKKKRADEDDEEVGEFKGTFRVYPLPSDPNEPMPPKLLRNLPPSAPMECIVRVYVIRAIDLPPQDASGLADPFLVVTLGKQKFSTRDHYIPNTLDPVFGRMFEFTAKIPVEKDLTVSVMDYDLISSDDIIGQTTIDLENRFLSKHRAVCGLPESYCITGPNKWRDMDCQTPSAVLDEYCEKRNLSKPKYLGDTQVRVDGKNFILDEFEDGICLHQHLGHCRERLALHVLNSFGDVVPEHVETRPLHTSIQPDMEQGKIQLFVDIFPKHLGAPSEPVDIGPRVANKYELRVIVWNTSDVYLEESNLVGEQMSDIYVKCWIAGIDDKLKTDTHYRSLNGEGNFNWRMLFPFDYLEAEKVMVVKKKLHFWSLDTTEERLPPRLVVQIWDNDTFNPDDFIGSVELNLDQVPMAFSKATKIKDIKCLEGRKTSSLFDVKSMFGWWPVFGELETKGKKEPALMGKVELTLELLSEQECQEKPTANARDEPNAYPTLPEPDRPATSFFFLTSPWKSFRYIIWRNYKWLIIGILLLILLIAIVVLFFYSMPGYSVKKMFGV